jgi:hypothetical protein
MRFCARQAGTELALFAGLRAARGATNRQRFLLCDFHPYTMHGNSPERWSIVTILQSLERSMISIREGARQRRRFWRTHVPTAAALSFLFFSGAIHVQ